jgi:uncharacterized membrane protein YhiD involved in acid resistance
MDQLLQSLRLEGGNDQVIGLWQVVASLTLCLVCTIAVGLLYRFTHKTAGYSQSYVQTLVLTSLVTTVIMLVIGSNIARAFSLVGALSIIRFRNAIKETRDVAYIFFAMAIAMACGTRFYGTALVGTAFISGVMVLLHLIDYGTSRDDPEQMVRVQLPPGTDPEGALGAALQRLFRSWSVVQVQSGKQGLATEVLLAVRPRKEISAAQVVGELGKANGNLKVAYHQALHTDDF